MGKHNRRNKHQSVRNNRNTHKHTKNDSNNSKNNAYNASVIQKIRHADFKIRHTSLIAVQNQILNPPKSSSSSITISLSVLQAIREVVMDNNMDCAIAATDCLVFYLDSISTTETKSSSSTSRSVLKEEYRTATAGWVALIVKRLQDCIAQVISFEGKANSKQWYALAASCFQVLCKLIELNELALERVMTTEPLKNDYLSVVNQFLVHVLKAGGSEPQKETTIAMEEYSALGEAKDVTAAAVRPSTGQANQQAQTVDNLRIVVAEYAARTLHSSLDDNPELIQCFCSRPGDEIVSLFGSSPSNSTDTSATQLAIPEPSLAQLHLAGCAVIIRQHLVHPQVEVPTSSAWNAYREYWHNAVMSRALPALVQSLETIFPKSMDGNDNDIPQSLRIIFERVSKSKQLWSDQQSDMDMEQDIIRMVDTRREPARKIARRQKEQKENIEKEQEKQQREKMEEDDDDVDGNDKAKKNSYKPQQDGRQALEDAIGEWNSTFVVPMQLTLEVTANLFNSLIATNQYSSSNDMDVEMDNDEKVQSDHVMFDDAIRNAILKSTLPQELVRVLNALCHSMAIDQDSVNESASSIPMEIKQDFEEIVSKSSACVANGILSASYFATDSDLSADDTIMHERLNAPLLWNVLKQHATRFEGISSIMVVVIQQSEMLRKQIRSSPEEVDFLISNFLSQDGHRTGTEYCMRDAVTMLAAIINCETVPTGSVEDRCIMKSTQALLRGLSSAAMSTSSTKTDTLVKCEVLNVLMDVFGQDSDYYERIFKEFNILGAFELGLSVVLKATQRLLQIQEWEQDEEQEINEIIFNSQRFVEYKKQ